MCSSIRGSTSRRGRADMALPTTRTAPRPAARPPPPSRKRGAWLSPLNQRRWRNFGATARLLVADHLLRPLRPVAVCRVHRQRQADPGAVSRRLLHADLPLLPGNRLRRRFPTEAIYADIEVECLIVSGGLETVSTTPRRDGRCRRRRGRGREIETRAGCSGRSIPYSYDTIVDIAPAPPPAARCQTTGWAPTTPRATCWRG
jgi:microcin C transport system permease protein